MSGHGRVDGEKENGSESHPRAKGPVQGKRQRDEEYPVQTPHGNPRAPLHGIGVVAKKDVLFRKATFVNLVFELPDGTEVESSCRHETSDPQLDQRGMFRIEAEVSTLDI